LCHGRFAEVSSLISAVSPSVFSAILIEAGCLRKRLAWCNTLTPLRFGCHYGFSEGDRSRRILHHDPGARDIYGTTSYGPAEFIGLSGRRQFRHVEPLPVSFRVPEVILKLLAEPAFSAGVEGD
jgi:hypothetical protein